MKYLVTRTYCNGPDMYDSILSVCVVRLSPELCQAVINRSESIVAASRDKSFSGASWHDGSPDWYGTSPFAEEWADITEDPDAEDTFQDGGHLLLDAEEVAQLTETEAERVECVQLHILAGPEGRADVFWSAYPKHCSIKEESASVPLSVFRQVLEPVPTP